MEIFVHKALLFLILLLLKYKKKKSHNDFVGEQDPSLIPDTCK